MNSEVLKVSSKSNPNNVAGAIAGVVTEKGKVELQAIGAGAINQTVKAIAIARGFVAPLGIDLMTVPAFSTVSVEDQDRTGMKFIVRGAK
ncbi:MAG: stage V sporulation protein S [Clostridia bacterium]|nr:stage V sporulation protein S [Clostridia bacterium]